MREQNDRYVFEHDLKDIFQSVWGYNAVPFFFLPADQLGGDDTDLDFGETIERRENNLLSVPFYAKNNNGNEVFMPIWLITPTNEWILLQNTVSSFTNKKTIVETPLVNRKGTVKEEISISDWEINIKGLIVSSDFDYPDEQVQQLVELYEIGKALGIQNARTSLLFGENFNDNSRNGGGNEMVVIRSLSFPELKGMKNVQPFEMNLVSDLDFELIIE